MTYLNLRFFKPFAFVFIFFSCTNEEIVLLENSDKELFELSMEINENPYQGVIDQNAKTVTFTIPFYFRFAREELSFNSRFVGKSISPDLSIIGDYSNPRQVTITAADDSQVTYTLAVNLLPEYTVDPVLEKTTYVQSDSIRIKGTNLGLATRVCLVRLNDLDSFDPFTGTFIIQHNILSDKVALNDTELSIPLNQLPLGNYDLALKFPDRDENIKITNNIKIE